MTIPTRRFQQCVPCSRLSVGKFRFCFFICFRALVPLICPAMDSFRRPNPNRKKRVVDAASCRTKTRRCKPIHVVYSQEHVGISHGANIMNQYPTCSRLWACARVWCDYSGVTCQWAIKKTRQTLSHNFNTGWSDGVSQPLRTYAAHSPPSTSMSFPVM